MKNLVTAFVMILCLASFLRLPIAGAANMCVAADDFGYLDIDPVDQEKTAWCWVASANAVTNHFNLTDPAKGNAPYEKCRLYEIAKPTGVDCCMDPDNEACQSSGWPWEVFAKLNPEIYYEGEGNWMKWAEVKEQICPDGNPGHPFIFIAQPATGGLAHTHVVKGFDHDPEGGLRLRVDDHAAYVGPRYIDYECKYKLPANCQQSETQWNRVGDVYDLRPLFIITDGRVPGSILPPTRPSGLLPSIRSIEP